MTGASAGGQMGQFMVEFVSPTKGGVVAKVGIDVGGVLIDSHADDAQEHFSGSNYVQTPAVADAHLAVKWLVQRFGRGRVLVISKCSERTARRTRNWLVHNGFVGDGMLDPKNVHYCRERAQKAPIAKLLELTHFIDDRADVLGYMDGIVSHRLLFGPQQQPANVPGLVAVADWYEALDRIHATAWNGP
jgi:hypothetical protein